jgi:hypothetical protein
MADANTEMKITIRIGNAFPELRTDLLAIPPRARAERLRHLAALGLNISMWSYSDHALGPVIQPTAASHQTEKETGAPHSHDGLTPARREFLTGLTGLD